MHVFACRRTHWLVYWRASMWLMRSWLQWMQTVPLHHRTDGLPVKFVAGRGDVPPSFSCLHCMKNAWCTNKQCWQILVLQLDVVLGADLGDWKGRREVCFETNCWLGADWKFLVFNSTATALVQVTRESKTYHGLTTSLHQHYRNTSNEYCTQTNTRP